MMIEQEWLASGERLLWLGNPKPGRYAAKKGAIGVVVGTVYSAFALIWLKLTWPALHFPAFGLLFVSVGFVMLFAGLCLMLSPAWHYWRAAHTTYALTDRRAVVEVAGIFPRLFGISLRKIQSIDARLRSGGVGDILFHDKRPLSIPSQMASQLVALGGREGYLEISDATSVERSLRMAIHAAIRGPQTHTAA